MRMVFRMIRSICLNFLINAHHREPIFFRDTFPAEYRNAVPTGYHNAVPTGLVFFEKWLGYHNVVPTGLV